MMRFKSYGSAVIDIPEHQLLAAAVDEEEEGGCIGVYRDDDEDVKGADDDDLEATERKRLLRKRKSAAIPCPRSWWSFVFFSWCEPLARLCEQRPLRFDDLWLLREEDTSKYCADQFKKVFATSHSLLFAAIRTQKKLLFWSGVISLGAVACELVGPIAVYNVVNAAATHEMATVYSKGAFWTLVLLGSRFLRSYSLAWADFLLKFVKVRVSGAMHVLLIESALDTNRFHQRRVISSTANLFTTDISNFGSAFDMIHRLWMVPLELFGLFYIFRWVAGRVITGILIVSFIVYALIQLVTWSESSIFRQWLSISDQRFGILERIFKHIVAIKLSTWEDFVLERVMAVRKTEQFVLKRHILIRTLRYTLTWIAPSVNLIATGVLLVNTPNFAFASPAFTFSAVAIFHAINDTFGIAVEVVQVFFQLLVSLDRIYEALEISHIPSSSGTRSRTCGSSGHTHSLGAASEEAVAIAGASFGNPTTPEKDLLSYVNLRVKRGEFVVIHGKVGCGKSVLLSSLLGFLPKQRGGVYLNGSFAFCSQVPWIQSMSIRDNILFGKAFDEVRYWSVLEACCLLEDLKNLHAGDRTVVGPHGLVSMSGGQQSRVALARACYSDADIYILDAPLDSVDSIVQCEILLKCMGQLLQQKTIILTTHNPEVIMCEYVDRAILMEQMVIQEPKLDDRPIQRMSRRAASENRPVPKAFQSKRSLLLGESATHGGILGKRRETSALVPTAEKSRFLRVNESIILNPLVLQIQSVPRLRPLSTSVSSSSFVNHASCAYRKKGWANVLKEYLAYTQSFSLLCIVVFLHHVTQVLSTMSVYYFSRWIASTSRAKDSPEALAHTIMLFDRYMWIVAASCVAFLCAAFATFSFSLCAADKLFECMTSALVHAPMRFFSTNSVGRILNRYARDLKSVDSSLQSVTFALLRSFFSSYCSLFASLAWLSGHILKVSNVSLHNDGSSSESHWAIWWLMMILIVIVTTGILGSFWRDGIQSNKPSGEIYLMFRETLSPLFNFVTESMSGKTTIASFGAEQKLKVASQYGEKVDEGTRILLAMWSLETWVAIRCLLMETLLTSSLLIALITFGHDPSFSNQPATIGLLLFLLLNIRDDLKNSFANWNLLEKDLACVERILEYIDVEPEGAHSQNQLPTDPFWPRHGAITFRNVYFQYDGAVTNRHYQNHISNISAHNSSALTGSMALKNVSFQIEGGQKIGVVGRSGAGKSSLAMALMRVNDPLRGAILVDGVDITHMHLKTLRSKISYVPPNPVFSNSSLRKYLDPMSQVEDAALWEILKKTGIEVSILKMQASLDASIMKMVSNWSTGERQLLCLSRALVFRSRIVILDEATTATDQETDCRVQDLVYEILDSNTTLLCIAHRLDTVLEFDKILVMADGGIEDFGTVQELVESGDGVFYNLLESAQLVY